MAMVAAMGGVWRRLGFVKLGIFDFFFFGGGFGMDGSGGVPSCANRIKPL